MTVPYENATSGVKARDEITKILRAYGCENVGFMDDFADHAVTLAFKHRGRAVQLRASAKGWAQMYLEAHPIKQRLYGHRLDEALKAREQKAIQQGSIAINSILRDWVKGQITAVETGILSFEAVFMPHMLTEDGRSVLECLQAQSLLPAPSQEHRGHP